MKDDFPNVAIIIAGGEGTRLRPLTLELPKPMVPVQGKPILEHVMDELSYNGVKRFILSVGYKADRIMNYFNAHEYYKSRVEYSIETKVLGIGGALRLAGTRLTPNDTENFCVMNGDQLFSMDMKKMYAQHKRDNALVTIALLEIDDVTGYGVCVLEGTKIVKFVQKPKREEAPSNLVNAGIYIMNRRVLPMLPDKESFSLETEFFEKEAPNGKIDGYVFKEQWITTDDFQRYENAIRNFKPRSR